MGLTNDELWKSLQCGDRVRIVHYPCEFSGHENTIHAETRAAYRHLIESKEVLTVGQLDEDGYPWVEFDITDASGNIEYHSLMLNHDGIQRVDELPAKGA
jgi:hypothetical protein